MTAKQQLKMAESQIAYWKAVAAEAKKDIRAAGAKKHAKKRRPDPRQIDLEDLIKQSRRKASKRSKARATNAKAKLGAKRGRGARVARASKRRR